MRYDTATLTNDVNSQLKTGNATSCRDLYGRYDAARRTMQSFIVPPELSRVVNLEQALYDQVDKYSIPQDVNYDDIQNIKMVSSDRNVDTMQNELDLVYRRKFSQKRRHSKNVVAINYSNGLKTISINHPAGLKSNTSKIIHDANSLVENGTWNVGGNITNLKIDYVNHITGKGSLKFDINNSGTTGYIENFTMKPFDIVDFINTGAIFTWVDINKSRNFQSVKLVVGSDPIDKNNDCYTFTVSGPHDNNVFTNNAWNLLKFPISEMEQTGTPNPRNLVYVRLEFATTGVEPIYGVHVDNIVLRKGVLYEMTYQSSFCFIDRETGEWKEKATSHTDLLPFEGDTYQIFMLECAIEVMREVYANNKAAGSDISDIQTRLKYLYQRYNQNHKSENIEPDDTLYIFGEMYSGYQDDILWGNNDGYDEPAIVTDRR